MDLFPRRGARCLELSFAAHQATELAGDVAKPTGGAGRPSAHEAVDLAGQGRRLALDVAHTNWTAIEALSGVMPTFSEIILISSSMSSLLCAG